MRAFSVPFPTVHAWERPISYGMMRNDQIGDCAIAAPAHMELNWGAVSHAGSPVSISDEQVVKNRKSTRLNSSHMSISYAVFCLKKKNKKKQKKQQRQQKYR